jgi:hypothetical protein
VSVEQNPGSLETAAGKENIKILNAISQNGMRPENKVSD